MDVEKFFDRKVILELLKKRVLDLKDGYRQNVAFLGSRHIRKTSILHKFMADLDDPRILPVYIDCERADLNDFVDQCVGGLLYHYSKIKNLPLHEDVRLLLENIQ